MDARLSHKQVREIIHLLGLLQTHLESAIETSLPPNSTIPNEIHAGHVQRDRLDWSRCEKMILKLDSIRSRKPGPK